MGSITAQYKDFSMARSHVALNHVQKQPTLSDRVASAAGIASASLSLSRRIVETMPEVDPNGPLCNKLGCATGGLGLILSGLRVKEGIKEYQEAQKIGDDEGQHRAEAQIASGALLVHASALLTTQKALLVAGSIPTAAAGLGAA